MIAIVKNKDLMYQMMEQGEFGNHFTVWKTAEELLASGYNGQVGIRSKRPGGPCWPHMPVAYAVGMGRAEEKRGNSIIYQESAPDSSRTIQGELAEIDGQLMLYYSYERCPMRPALFSGGKHASGSETKWILKNFLNENSYADIMELLDRFPGHVIEFTAFSHFVGWAKGRNHVIWEVRLY